MNPMEPTGFALHISNHEDPARAIDIARAAALAGIDRVWLSEDLFYFGAIPIASAILTATESLTVGFSVLTPYARHVSALAMDIASLQAIAPGRLVFGVGSGVQARVDRMGAQWQNPTNIVRDTIDLTTRLFAGETLTVSNTAASTDRLALSMAEIPPLPPVYVAAMGPKALDQAGRLYAGVLLTIMAAAPYVEWAAGAVRAGAAQADRSTPDVVATVPVRVSADGELARVQARELVAGFIRRWHAIPALRTMFTTHGVLEDGELDAIVEQLESGADAADAIPDQLALAYCAAGTAADVVEQLGRWSEAGATSLNLELDEHLSPDQAGQLLTSIISIARSAT